MMYNEFLTIAGLKEDEVSFEVYSKEIEPAYREMPFDLTNDKKAFAKWWKSNRELCRWISQKVLDLDMMNSAYARDEKKIAGLVEKHDQETKDFDNRIETMVEQNCDLGKQVHELKLRAAFAPDALINDVRLEIFPNYEVEKACAVAYGIIKG